MVHVDLVELYKKKGKMIVGSVWLYCQWERVCSIEEKETFVVVVVVGQILAFILDC